MDRDWDGEDTPCADVAKKKVVVVGGGLAGLMAARTLARWGAAVTVYEARAQVGGRVLSDTTFAKGRITEFGAELVGSIHTRWCALAREYGLALISRMSGDLYRGQRLTERIILDRPLTPREITDLGTQLVDRVLRPMAEFASRKIPAGKESQPWREPSLLEFDNMSVATALEKRFGVRRDERLWQAIELFLVNNNVSPLDKMSFLALLCLVRGGQTENATIEKDPLMGYWDELEIYRCGDGCQRLALAIAAEVKGRKNCAVLPNRRVRQIELDPVGGGVLVTAPSTKSRYDYVVLAVPPTVWGDIQITPFHPKDVIGLMGSGAAVKFFSNVRDRFWIKDGFAPLGGSLEIGQVWEGTDNQTRVAGQDIVLSVFTGSRTPTEEAYKNGLERLYPGYRRNLTTTKIVDWSKQPFIETGYSSPQVGQVFTIGRQLNEPFQGRLFFAGEHTQLDHFGYMEGAIRSGERAARLVRDQVCKPPSSSPPLVASVG